MDMKATEFYQRVAHQLRTDKSEAKQVTLQTLEGLRHRLSQEVAQELVAQLPSDMEHQLQNPEYDALYDKEAFVGPLMNRQDTEAEWDRTLGGLDLVAVHNIDDVTQQIQGVFSVLKQCVNQSTADQIAACLPNDVDQWFIGAQ